jgi:hypothetical protein
VGLRFVLPTQAAWPDISGRADGRCHREIKPHPEGQSLHSGTKETIIGQQA